MDHSKYEELAGFDLNLPGFDCIDEIEDLGQPWVCPFKPGCGAKTPSDCAAARQFAKVLRAPQKLQ
jgi:hypothetical protein